MCFIWEQICSQETPIHFCPHSFNRISVSMFGFFKVRSVHNVDDVPLASWNKLIWQIHQKFKFISNVSRVLKSIFWPTLAASNLCKWIRNLHVVNIRIRLKNLATSIWNRCKVCKITLHSEYLNCHPPQNWVLFVTRQVSQMPCGLHNKCRVKLTLRIQGRESCCLSRFISYTATYFWRNK